VVVFCISILKCANNRAQSKELLTRFLSINHQPKFLLTSKYKWAFYYLSSSEVPSIDSFECRSCLSS